ncbi:PREDICTED: probable protein phosphatase 2C 28 [Nicotiana attenuata]|nr:PREDICTED: probable protein phosphatase 2C 28 [Nicotiana attenuata]
MTRAFGDAKVKDHITVEPNVTIEKIDKDTDSIILASDGLWKVMSNEEVAECIRGIEHCNKAAEELITESLMRGSPDDISCVVVMFH